MFKLLTSLIILVLATTTTVSAQFGFSDTVSIESNPRNPQPNEQVVVSLEAFSFDLDASMIEWSLNGTVVVSEEGLDSITVAGTPAGTETLVEATITTPFGAPVRKTLVIRPSVAFLTWEALSNTPPLYRGKALRAPGAPVRIIATPYLYQNGVRIPPSDLLYTWKQGSRTIGEASRRGESVIVFNGTSPVETLTVTVEISSLDGRVQSEGTLSIPTTNPEIMLYKKDQLLGLLYNQAIDGSFTTSESEVTLRAEPYFFSNEVAALNYEWFIDNERVNFGGSEVVFESTNRDEQALVEVIASNTSSLFQEVQKRFTILFGRSSGLDI